MAGYLQTICACAVGLLVLAPRASSQTIRLDLKQWGYKTPESSPEEYRRMPSQLVSIAANEDIAVSFVTHDRFGLATRELPPLSLHVLKFSPQGKYVSDTLVPTASWNLNAVLLGSNGKYLLRANDRLILLSPNMKRLMEVQIPSDVKGGNLGWHILALPDRGAALLYRESGSDGYVSLLRWDDLKAIAQCTVNGYADIESVSNKNLLISIPSAGFTRRFELREICGAQTQTYSWTGDPLGAALVNDTSVLLVGFSNVVRLMTGSKVQWSDAFNKRDRADEHVEVGADGRVLAVAVKTFAGGNRLLDIDSHLQRVRIVVYDPATGKRILEVPVTPTPASMFDFALSPQGDILAVVSDGQLAIVPMEQRPPKPTN